MWLECKALWSADPARGASIRLHPVPGACRTLPVAHDQCHAAALSLQAWRNKLQSDLEDKMPSVLRLEEECRGLQELALGELEMPGQQLGGQQVAQDATVYLEYISANIQVGPGPGLG